MEFLLPWFTENIAEADETGAEAAAPSCTSVAAGPDGPDTLSSTPQIAEPVCGPGGSERLVTVIEDPQVLALEEGQRLAVAELAKSLTRRDDGEDGSGLCDDTGALIRYLVARNWNLEAAEASIRKTARWRQDFGFSSLLAGDSRGIIEKEIKTGKLYVRGYDRVGRPVLYLKPGRENTGCPQGIPKLLVYCMERAAACLERKREESTGQSDGKFCLIVNFQSFGLSHSMSIATARDMVSILQDHYPERFSHAFLINPPGIFQTAWRLISQVMDPVSLAKVIFVPSDSKSRAAILEKHFDLVSLEKGSGGLNVDKFDPLVFLGRTDSDVFGLELNEQLANAAGVNGTSTYLKKLEIDHRYLILLREERELARELAHELQGDNRVHDEDPSGLYDDPGALIRHLRASGWSVPSAAVSLRRTARWRMDFQIASLRTGVVQEDFYSTILPRVMHVRGYDKQGRPVLLLDPWGLDPKSLSTLARYFVYCLERAGDCADLHDPPSRRGQRQLGQFTILLDCSSYSMFTRPSIGTIYECVSIVLEHYPERVHEVLLLEAPLRLRLVKAALWSFLPAEYYQKLVFVDRKKLRLLVHVAAMEKRYGGESTLAFDPEVFFWQEVQGDVFGYSYEEQFAAFSAPRPLVEPSKTELAPAENDDSSDDEYDAARWFGFV